MAMMRAMLSDREIEADQMHKTRTVMVMMFRLQWRERLKCVELGKKVPSGAGVLEALDSRLPADERREACPMPNHQRPKIRLDLVSAGASYLQWVSWDPWLELGALSYRGKALKRIDGICRLSPSVFRSKSKNHLLSLPWNAMPCLWDHFRE